MSCKKSLQIFTFIKVLIKILLYLSLLIIRLFIESSYTYPKIKMTSYITSTQLLLKILLFL